MATESDKKSESTVDIDYLIGLALGCIGMSLNDFSRCTPEEFRSIFDNWHERQESQIKESWEQIRIICLCVLQPHSKKTLSAKEVLSFPWDEKSKIDNRASNLSNDEILKRFEAAKNKYGFCGIES